VKVWEVLPEMFSDGDLLDMANNIDVAKDGLTDKLRPGTVDLFTERIGLFQQLFGQP
jgi:hypothetical protein